MPARTVKDMLEHFPNSRYGAGGKSDAKSDPQLVWTFEEADVNVKSFEIGVDTRGCLTLHSPDGI
jgi:cell cycle checkpoint control protein RAD9A